jgi:hypothetical protein
MEKNKTNKEPVSSGLIALVAYLIITKYQTYEL